MKTFRGSPTPLLRIVSLGGAGSVTKNMHVYEYGHDILIVDCGVGFPDESMLGVDLLIPDISHLLAKRERIHGILLTHAHEDHMGALGYILPRLPVPVYATKLTAGLARNRLSEMRVAAQFHPLPTGKPFRLGPFTVEAIPVTHSVPDAVALYIACPAGRVLHAADFKFDWTPVDGRLPDVARLARLGASGIDILLSDCLRSEKAGYTLSERVIEDTFELEAQRTTGKLIVTTASSNISRIQQAVTVGVRHGRKVSFVGRSVEQNVEVAVQLGFLAIPSGWQISADAAASYPPHKLLLVVSGSQGQEGSALARMAHGQHKVKVLAGDTVLFSADPIPGSEEAVHAVIDLLVKRGARVQYSDVLDDLHVSGHAARDELALMIALTKPSYLLPIGGTYRMMKQYQLLALKMGYNEGQVLLTEEGEVIELAAGKVKRGVRLSLKNVMVDSLGVSEGNVVLRDRQVLAEDGIVIAVVPLDQGSGELSGKVDLIARGFVEFVEGEELDRGAREAIGKALGAQERGHVLDWRFLRRQITNELETYLFRETKKRPMILPVLMEV